MFGPLASLMAAAALQAAVPAAEPVQTQVQAGDAATYLREADYRVARVGYAIGLAGLSHCPRPYPITGLLLHHLAEYGEDDRPSAVQAYALDRGPGVLAVMEGSPAARAGLIAGDVLLAVNERPFPSPVAMAKGKDNEAARPAIEATEALLETELRRGAVRLRVWRGGVERDVALDSRPGCPARVRLARSNQMNAFSNRGYAIMTTALLGFLKDDDELAVVLGHEIAHAILNHPAQLDAAGVPRGILRGFGKNASRVRATEEEADRLGLKLAWAAGYDVSAAIPYWRRFYGKYDRIPQIFRTHPSLHARERLIRQVLLELGAPGSDLGAKRPELGEGPLRQR